MIEHTKIFSSKFLKFNIFLKKILSVNKKEEFVSELEAYYNLRPIETNSLFAEISMNIVMSENVALIQDFIVALREQNWMPDLSKATVVGTI